MRPNRPMVVASITITIVALAMTTIIFSYGTQFHVAAVVITLASVGVGLYLGYSRSRAIWTVAKVFGLLIVAVGGYGMVADYIYNPAKSAMFNSFNRASIFIMSAVLTGLGLFLSIYAIAKSVRKESISEQS